MENELALLELEAERLAKKKAVKNFETQRRKEGYTKGGSRKS